MKYRGILLTDIPISFFSELLLILLRPDSDINCDRVGVIILNRRIDIAKNTPIRLNPDY